jgi:hypothetical protein
VKVRLHGTRQEVAEATRRLVQVFDVVAVSEAYPDRGASVLVRVYLDVRVDPASPTNPASAGSARPASHSRKALP